MNTFRLRAIALALGTFLALVLAPPASATDYGKPSGRWFEAIVSHEVGHCLGWFEHNTAYPSIMRASLKPTYINSGSHTYKPTSTDLSRMAASRVNSVAGEDNTTYVQYPFVSDLVPVYNKTGRSSAFTAADRWDPYTPLNLYSVSSEPSQGITIVWDWSLDGQSIGGYADVTRWEWSGEFWQVADCVVRLNPDVETSS